MQAKQTKIVYSKSKEESAKSSEQQNVDFLKSTKS